MPGDPIESLGRELADLRRRISALETAPRANLTTVANGQTRWLDANGDESVAIGVDDSGDAYLRAWNSDGTAPVLDVRAGLTVFPAPIGVWTPTMNRTLDANGMPTYDGATWATMLYTMLALTSDTVDLGGMASTLSAGTCDWQVISSTVNQRTGHVTVNGLTVATDSQSAGSGTPLVANVTMPSGVWSPASNPVGAVVILEVQAKITSGGGTVAVRPHYPAARCV